MYCEKPQIQVTESGYWINFRNYSRLVLCSPQEAQEAERSLNAVQALQAVQKSKDNHQNRVKTVVYRDADGKINVPPEPSMIPPGCERIEIKSLAEADRITKELKSELSERFSHDFTDDVENLWRDKNGNNSIEWLRKYGAKTDKGREIVNVMIQELEREQRDRQNVQANTYFRWREFDRLDR